MKKYVALITFFISGTLICQTEKFLRIGCDKIYTTDAEDILTQFTNLASKNELQDYRQFMIALKQASDMKFKITAFEDSIPSLTRARLRTPLQNYSRCRTTVSSNLGLSIQTIAPPEQILAPCDRTYAVLVQEILNEFSKEEVGPELLKQYQDFMILLKEYEDLVFLISEFEKRTDNTTTSRLRLPLVQYNTCRDSIIRREASPPGYPQ